jgi:hypothetical protein
MNNPQIDNEYGDYPIFISTINSIWAGVDEPDMTYGDFYLSQLKEKYPEAAELVEKSPYDLRGKHRFPINVHDIVGGWFGRKYYFESGQFVHDGPPGGWRKHAHQGLSSEYVKNGPSIYDPKQKINNTPNTKDI